MSQWVNESEEYFSIFFLFSFLFDIFFYFFNNLINFVTTINGESQSVQNMTIISIWLHIWNMWNSLNHLPIIFNYLDACF